MSQDNRMVNVVVEYEVDDGLSIQDRKVEVILEGLSDEQFDRAWGMDMNELLEKETFKDELIRRWELNSHHVIPVEGESDTFTSAKEGDLFKAEIKVTGMYLEEGFEEKEERKGEFWDEFFGEE